MHPLGTSKEEDDEFEIGKAIIALNLRNLTNTARVREARGVIEGSESDLVWDDASIPPTLFAKPSSYHISFIDHNLCICTLFAQDASQIVTINARKIDGPDMPDDQPWYSKFGTPVIFIVAMTFSRVLKSYFGKQEQPPASAPTTGSAPSTSPKPKQD